MTLSGYNYLSIMLSLLSSGSFAQSFIPAANIAYPFRSAPAIVQTGKQFPVLYNNRAERNVDSMVLKGPFSRIRLRVDSVTKGRFEYDTYTTMYTNNKIWATVPAGSPEDMYDLIIYSAGEVNSSRRSVKLVRNFSQQHRFIHISDTHVSRNWIGSQKDGYAEELQLLDRFIDVANIIAPDLVIVTGDLIHDYTRFNQDARGWGGETIKDYKDLPSAEEKFRNYFEGAKGFRGVQSINAPVFSIPGNHDFYGMQPDNYLSKASQWNTLCGMRVFGLTYAHTRFLFADDFLGDPVSDIPSNAPMNGLQGKKFVDFLNEKGKGEIRIMAQHRHDRMDTAFLNKHAIKLVLNGHNHSPHIDTLGTTPTYSMRTGVVCRSGEKERWKKVLGFFRIFWVDGDKLTYSEPLRFCSNPADPYQQLKLNLTLNFIRDNTGKSDQNEVSINNKLPANLPGCRIRFVMKKGNYMVAGGTVHQTFNSGNLSIVDVNTDVAAKSIKKVTIKLKS